MIRALRFALTASLIVLWSVVVWSKAQFQSFSVDLISDFRPLTSDYAPLVGAVDVSSESPYTP